MVETANHFIENNFFCPQRNFYSFQIFRWYVGHPTLTPPPPPLLALKGYHMETDIKKNILARMYTVSLQGWKKDLQAVSNSSVVQ